MSWLVMSSTCTGRNVAHPTCSVTKAVSTPLTAYRVHETGRNVEARRRRGDASTLASIDGLVPFRVFQWRLNVRRKWHDADFVEPVLFTQLHGAGTVIVRLQDLARYSNSAPAKLE